MFRNGVQIESLAETDCQAFIAMARQVHEETYPAVPGEAWDQVFGAGETDMRPAEYGKPDCHYLVARHANQIIGYAKIRLHDDGFAFLEKLHVLRAFQKQGCGNWLLQACFLWSLQKQRTKMHMRVFMEDIRAIAFFQKQGFSQVGAPSEAELASGNFDFKLVCNDIRARLRAQPASSPAIPSLWDRPEAKIGGGALLSLATWLLASRVTPSGPLQLLSVLVTLGVYVYKTFGADGAGNDAKPADEAGEKLLSSSMRI